MPPKATRFTLGTQPNQPVGSFLSKEYMRLKLQTNEPLECSICLEDICCNRCICVLMCGHHYHFECISKNQTGKCPLCIT